MDYVIAYYPSIALFYKSKVAKRFDPSTSTEAMQALLSNLTGMFLYDTRKAVHIVGIGTALESCVIQTTCVEGGTGSLHVWMWQFIMHPS